jgi:DNA-binding beta-propeller fold protein YncE
MPAIARIAPVLLLAVWGCGGGASQPSREATPSSAASGRDRAVVPRAAREDHARGRERRRYRAVVALERANAAAILAGPPWWRMRRVAVAAGPHNVDASPRGDLVAVTSPPADVVTVLDTRGRIRIRARVGISGAPHDTVFTANGRRLWVAAEQDRRLVQLAMPGGRVVRSVPMPGAPHDLALVRDGREIWVTIDGSSAVERRSARTGRSLGQARPGRAPHDLAVAPSGRHVWLSNWSSGVLTVASAQSGRAIDDVSAGVEPHHFAFTRRRAWASDNATGAVTRIGLRTRRVLGRTRVGGSPHHVAAVGGGALVAVHETGRVAALSARGQVTASVPAGAGPHGLAVVPAPTPRR